MKIETEPVARAIFEMFGGSGWDALPSNVKEVYWKAAEAAIANVLHQQHEAMQKEMDEVRTLEREATTRQLKQYQQQIEQQGDGA